MMSRASLVRYSCPWRVKPIFPMTHRPCLIFELGDEHRLGDPAGHGVRSRPGKEIATNRQGEAARNLNRSSAIPDGYLRFHLALFPPHLWVRLHRKTKTLSNRRIQSDEVGGIRF